MHPNPAYRPDNREESLDFAREAGFGVLAVSLPDDAPMLSHVPFLLSGDGAWAELHLVRSNPIARAVTEAAPAKIAVQGPEGYISPDWYEMDGQVPTWNYVAVHLTGRLVPLDDAELPRLLERLSDQFETRLLPKPVWTMGKLDEGAAAKMMRMIRPFRLEIDRVESTWKLAQNKPEAARLAAAEHLNAQGLGGDRELLAAMMRMPPK